MPILETIFQWIFQFQWIQFTVERRLIHHFNEISFLFHELLNAYPVLFLK